MVEERGRLGVTPVEFWANNAPPNFADLYADRETTVGKRMKSRLIGVSNHPGALVGWISTLIKRDLAHRPNPPRTKIPLTCSFRKKSAERLRGLAVPETETTLAASSDSSPRTLAGLPERVEPVKTGFRMQFL